MRRDTSGTWEAALTLAMLPVGATLALLSALAAATALMGAMALTLASAVALVAGFPLPTEWGRLLLLPWLWGAGLAGAWATVTAVEALGGLSWRAAARVAAAWGAVALAYPGWWAE